MRTQIVPPRAESGLFPLDPRLWAEWGPWPRCCDGGRAGNAVFGQGSSGKEEIVRKPAPGTPRVIYMDAGVWNGPEEGLPKMTFGLMEHNGIALCTYFCDGTRSDLPIDPDLGYDFYKTQMFAFLTLMMEKKYKVRFVGNRNPLMGCHVLRIFPFPAKSLLDNESELRILVPDLHLHFFKGTYLDNFVTYYRNACGTGRIVPVRLGRRTSMEADFGVFLETIAAFQKSVLKNTHVHFLGDTCELWETESVVRYYRSDEEAKKAYTGLDDLGRWVLDNLEKSPQAEADARYRTLKGYVRQLTSTKLADTPLDPEAKKQLDAVYSGINRKKYLFDVGEDSATVTARAKQIRAEILNKHRGPRGQTFTELLDTITWKHWIDGNHDNYLSGINNANDTFAFSPPEIQVDRFRYQYTFERCAFLYNHGHNMDFFNNDDACALGRVITCLLTFYELKGRGDLVRKFEGIFRSDQDVRLDYVKKIARLCYLWEKETPAIAKKNKVIVLAHTHIPELKDMTNEALVWKWAEELFAPPKNPPNKQVRAF